MMRWFLALIIFSIFLPQWALSQPGQSDKIGLGVEIGHWRPNDLSDAVVFTPALKSKSQPYIGMMLLMPWRWSMTFRASLGYWNYCNDEATPATLAVEITSLLIDLKYCVLSDVMLMPYLSYGIGWFAGKSLRSRPRPLDLGHSDELGIGANIGTGFDFRFSRRLNLAAEFRYHYVKFKHTVAFTDNYSGPKISIGFIYWF